MGSEASEARFKEEGKILDELYNNAMSEEILEIGDKTVREMSFSKVYMAAEDADDVNGNWFAVFSTPERGRCLLVFNPNEQILQGMKPYLKRELMLKLFYKRGENA